MTPLPKRRWSTHRQGKKRASFKMKSFSPSRCSHCGALKKNHGVCPNCGYYRGKQIVHIKQKKSREDKKVENQE